LQADPALVPRFVDELLRLDSPVQHIGRWAAEDFDYGTASITKGDPVVLLPGAANRDPAAWSQPGEVVFDRTREARHVTFGSGRHYCLGAALARAEAALAIEALAHSFHGFEILEPVTYRSPANVRCPDRLVVNAPH
jgi:cytochrome P450